MPVLVQICIGVATAGLVALCIAIIRTLGSIDRMMKTDVARLAESIQQTVVRVDMLVDKSNELVDSVRGTIAPLQAVVGRLSGIGERAANLSSRVMDEVEPPVNSAAAIMHATRAGAGYIVRSLAERFMRRRRPAPETIGID